MNAFPNEVKRLARVVGITVEELVELEKYMKFLSMKLLSTREIAIRLRKCLKEIKKGG